MDYIILIILMLWLGSFVGASLQKEELKTQCFEERVITINKQRFKCEHIGKEL